MPVYEYACENCGTRFERSRSIHDEPIRECPNCGNRSVHKLFHTAGLIFKGSGWYVTDSRKSSSGVTNEAKTGSTDTGSKEVADPSASSGQAPATPSGEKPKPAADAKKVADPPAGSRSPREARGATPGGKKVETE